MEAWLDKVMVERTCPDCHGARLRATRLRFTIAGKTMTVNLTGVADVQAVTLTLSGLTDVFSQALPNQTFTMKMLVGDTTGNASVGAGDIAQTNGQAGAAVTEANCRQDVTVNGGINAGDIGLVKSRAGASVP